MAWSEWQPLGAQPPFEVSYFGIMTNVASKTESFKLPKGKYIIIPIIWGRDGVGVWSIGTVSTSPSVSPISDEVLTSFTTTLKRIEVKKYVYNFTEPTTVTIQYLCGASLSLGAYAYLAIPYNNYLLTKIKASATASSNEVLTSGKYKVLSLTGGTRMGYNCSNTITVPSGTKLSEIHRLGSEVGVQVDAKEVILQTTGETITITGANSDTATGYTAYIYLIWKMS